MSAQVWIRPYSPDQDGRLLVEWLHAAREKNRYDPEIFLRGQAEVYVAYDASGPVGFIPVVNGNQVESLAFRPGLPTVTEAKALQAWMHVFVYEAHRRNLPDAFFVTLDETVLAFAQRYGWAPVAVPMLNLHVADLEGGMEAPDGRT